MKKIKIGNLEFNVEIADTPETREKGLMDIKELPKDLGMLFVWDEPQEIDMWMKDTLIPLDIVFINEDFEVTSVLLGQPNDETLLSQDNTQYVVELNQNSGVTVGDTLDLDPSEDVVMKVLAPDGSTLMDLKGGERIVSRRETKVLIKKAKKAYKSKSDNDYKTLGKYMFKVLKGLDNRPNEYVESPNK